MPARKKKAPARKKHLVKADLRIQGLSKAGSSLTLRVYANDYKIGTLEIGRGSLYWYGRSRHTRKRIDWTAFAEMMDGLAYGK